MADDRLIETSDSELERQMLRAAADEKVPADVRRRALASLGLLAIAPLGTVSTAAAATDAATAAVKTLGWQASLAKIGAIGGLGGAVLGAGAAVVQSPAYEQPREVDTASVSRPAAPKQPLARLPSDGAREATLSITSKGLSPWAVRAAPSSTSTPFAERPPGARAVTASRNKHPVASEREHEAPIQPAATSIREEIDLLDRARAQLTRGNPAAATELISRYFARFPTGELRAEAELVRREARMAGE